jgi:hypothetical protein
VGDRGEGPTVMICIGPQICKAGSADRPTTGIA